MENKIGEGIKVVLIALVLAAAFFCLGWIPMTAGCDNLIAECVQVVN